MGFYALSQDQRIEANDHLLKAVIALLTIKDPTFVKQLDDVFLMAEAQGDKIARMDAMAWAHIREELGVVRGFVLGDEDADDDEEDEPLADGAADGLDGAAHKRTPETV